MPVAVVRGDGEWIMAEGRRGRGWKERERKSGQRRDRTLRECRFGGGENCAAVVMGKDGVRGDGAGVPEEGADWCHG